MFNDSEPVFFRQPLEPVPEYPKELLSTTFGTTKFQNTNDERIKDLDRGLATCWQVMRRFCLLVNLAAQTQASIHAELIYGTMIAVMYRLLRMDFSPGSLDQCIRHGLVVFSYHIFLQWQDVRLPYTYFPNMYKDCVLDLKLTGRVSSRLMLWLLMIGASSLYKVEEEEWLRLVLREHVEKCQVRTWNEMQDILKSYMWIGLLDDRTGKEIFELIRERKEKE